MKMKNLLTAITVAAVLMVAASTPAAAQAPPMNLSWGIASQMQYQARGDAFARSMAQYYLNYMQQLRAAGYTGPSIDTGFNAQTLQQAGQAANAATQRYIQGSMVNSQKTFNAASDYDLRAIRGCTLVYTGYYVCP
jgi:hypothetical protein